MADGDDMVSDQEGKGPFRQGRFFAYDDATGKELRKGDTLVGNLTIGRGHNLTALGLPEHYEALLFDSNMHVATLDARRLCSIYDELSRPRQLVLISMAFNLGYVKYAKWTRFWDAIHRKDWEEAADQIIDSKAYREDAPSRYGQLASMMREDVSKYA